MAKQKKPVHKVEMTEGNRAIIQQLFQAYDIENATDIQDALKDLHGGTIKEMMEAEMDDHLSYSKSEPSESENARNGYKSKQVNSSYGSFQIDAPQDRKLSTIHGCGAVSREFACNGSFKGLSRLCIPIVLTSIVKLHITGETGNDSLIDFLQHTLYNKIIDCI